MEAAAVFSGFVLGYAYSLLFTGFASVMLIRARSQVPFLAKAIAPRISPVMLAVPISMLAFLGWTMVGLLLGMLYAGATEYLEGAGLGSPNWPFTLGIVVAGVVFLGTVLYAWGRLFRPVVALTLTFVGLFGWALPYLSKAAE